jgi:hypothetical protein
VDPAAAYEKARKVLAPFPKLQSAFVRICSPLVARDDLSVLLLGSIGGGRVDAMSDIDLEVVVHDASRVALERARIDERIRTIGNLLAHFPATHLGMDDLLVYFVEDEGTVIKIDVWTSDVRIVAGLGDAQIIHDPGGVVAAERARLGGSGGRPPPDYDDLHQKFVGWMWFTAIKVRRGHLFEAIESIDFMRSFALLPFIHLVDDNPPQGYRHLEDRVPPAHADALRETFVCRYDPAEVTRAFWSLVELFRSLQPEVEKRLGRPLKGGALAQMTDLVRQRLS